MNELKKRQVLVVLLVASFLPAFLLLPFPGNITLQSLALWLADSLGYAGIVGLLWLYILGAKSVMGLVFKDLAPVLHIHKLIGRYAPIAIFLHPLLIMLSFGESVLYPFLIQTGSQYDTRVTLGRIALLFVVTTWGISWFLKKRMAFRPWKYLHYLAYLAVPFALLHVPDVGSNFITVPVVKAYFLVLSLMFVVVSVLRLRGFLNLDKSSYRVTKHVQLTETDYVLTLAPLGRHIVPHRGEYVYVKLGILSEDHPFSVLSYDETTGNLSVGYRVFGSYTKVMTKIAPGARVDVGGPYGSFMSHINDSSRSVVFLAGGIGITPFVDEVARGAHVREQWLFAANRSRETAVLVPEVATHLGDHLVNVYNTAPAQPLPREETGFITIELLRKYLGNDLARYDFYLCGPPPMMKAMRALMEAANVPNTHVQFEKFGW